MCTEGKALTLHDLLMNIIILVGGSRVVKSHKFDKTKEKGGQLFISPGTTFTLTIDKSSRPKWLDIFNSGMRSSWSFVS